MSRDDMRRVIKTRESAADDQDLALSEIDEEFLAERKKRRTLIIVVILLVALLGGLLVALVMLTKPLDTVFVQSKTGSMTWIQSIYGTGKEDLYAPTSVAVGPSSSIYVAEPQRSRIAIFDADGSFDRSLGTSIKKGSAEASMTVSATSKEVTPAQPSQEATKGLIPMQRPESVFVDDQGTLYIADPLLEQVFVLDRGDTLIRTIKLGEPARGVGTSDTEIFVLGEGRVYVFGKGGGSQPVRWFGGRGNYPGEINAYQGIEVVGDVVYIADSSNHRIEAFTTQGDFLWSNPSGVASVESTSSIWDLPQDLTIDGADHLVIVDALRFELSQASAVDGAFIDAWGDFGSGDGQFSYPSSVAYDSDRDRFIVADTKNNRVQIVTLPNSSTGVKGLVNSIGASPWKYILAPISVVLLCVLFGFVGRKVYVRRKRKAELESLEGFEDTIPVAASEAEEEGETD